MTIDPHIFRAYDVRGIVGRQLTAEVARRIAQAYASALPAHSDVLVARDARLTSIDLHQALIDGLLASGCDVVDLGLCPTPLAHYTSEHLRIPNIAIVTGSHNPMDYNGIKFMQDGQPVSGNAIHQRLMNAQAKPDVEPGSLRRHDPIPLYTAELSVQFRARRPLKVAFESYNGVSAVVVPPLFQALGHEAVLIHDRVDDPCPTPAPDPSQASNLVALQRTVVEQGCDAGFAFDGDGDRVVAVDEQGEIIYADELIAALAISILKHAPLQAFVYDIKCSYQLPRLIEQHHGRAIACASGHTHLRAAMREHKAIMGGEYSGHVFIKDAWYGFDDGHYVALRLLNLLQNTEQPASVVLRPFQRSYASGEYLLPFEDEASPDRFMQRFLSKRYWDDGKRILIDGLRQEFDDGWLLIRRSNTTPSLSIRFEADSAARLAELQQQLRAAIIDTDPTLNVPF